MPRLKMTDKEKRNNVSVSFILAWLQRDGRKWSDLAKICGFHPNTARNRRKNPESFTVCELRRMKGLTDEEIVGIVRGRF